MLSSSRRLLLARARAPLKQSSCHLRTKVHQNDRSLLWFQSTNHHSLVGLPCSSDYVDRERKQTEEHRWLLYERSMPRINASATNPTQRARWMSTCSTTRDGQQQQQREHSSINLAKDDSDESSSSSSEPTKTLAERTQERTEQLRERAQEMSDHVQQQVDDFRENPRETTVAGAKSAGSALKKYGPVFVGTYFVVYVSTLASFFAGVEIGALDPVTLFSWIGNAQEAGGEMKNTVDLVVEWMRNHEFTKNYADVVAKNPSAANLAVAWIAVKFTEPIRFGLTVAITPRLSRYLGFAPQDQQSDDVENDTEKATKESESGKGR